MASGLHNIKVSKVVVVTIVILSAIGFPVYFLLAERLSVPSARQWLLLILYSIVVLGFVFMGVGVKVIDVTSEETDNKIKEKKAAFDKAVNPYIIAAFIGFLIWLVYSIIELYKNT
jgi:predicted permease